MNSKCKDAQNSNAEMAEVVALVTTVVAILALQDAANHSI